MDIKKLQRAIVDGLEDVKAQHISVFNTEHLSSMFERVIIASGTSNRQTKALAASVRNSVKGRGMQVLATEGEDNGEWIIVDCGAAVAHIMQPAIREYYHLEEIWGGKSVRMKVGEVSTKLVKASEPEPVARKAAPKRSQPAPQALEGEPPARAKPAARKPAKPKTEADKKMANKSAAYKRVASKAPAKKTSPSSPVKTMVVKTTKAPAKRAIAQKTVARKTPPRRAAAKKVPSRGR